MKQLVVYVFLLACLAVVWLDQGIAATTRWSQQGNGGTLMRKAPTEEASKIKTIPAATTTAYPVPLSNPRVASPFRILCTTDESKITSGSYELRCEYFKSFAEQYYPSDLLQIDAVAPRQAVGHYNATITIKTLTIWLPELMERVALSEGSLTLGDIFVDVLDMPLLPNAEIPSDHHVVVQNDLHAKEVYDKRPSHLVHIVPHWFNSFVTDSASPTPVLPAPKLRKDTPLRLGLIWNPLRVDYKHRRRIVSMPKDGSYKLQAVNMKQSDIGTWMVDHYKSTTIRNANGELESIETIANDTLRGDPYLYQLLFRQFDVLLVLGKTRPSIKKRYNCVQRAISQMRSGIPVLLECHPSQQVLCDRYPPSCQFTTADEMREALEQMKDIKVRQACAQRGVEITKDYMPRKIIDDYLSILGFMPQR